MALRERIQSLVEGLDEEDLSYLKKSLRLKAEDELPSWDALEDICTPTFIGPTWDADDSGWKLPEKTLGWELAAWCVAYLADPNDPEKPWDFTPEQLRFFLWWYAVDSRGKFLWRKGVLQRLKGWGKDPLIAVICLVEMLAPCRFKEWSAFGLPVGRPVTSPLVQVSAVTQEQSYNTGDMFPILLTNKCIREYGVKPGIDLVRARNGRAKIQMITSSPRAMEGKRVTFAVLNEVHQWVDSNGGPAMYRAVSRNLAKIADARFLAITNAYMPGEGSVGEMLRGDFEKAGINRRSSSLLYDSIEADPRAPIVGPLVQFAIEGVRGDATWLDLEAIEDEMATESIDIALSRRFWLNQIVASDDRIYGPEDWDHLGSLGNSLRRGDKIVLGFDGGKTDDATALIAIRLKDQCVFPLQIWEMDHRRKGDNAVIDYASVDYQVRQAFKMYDVHAFYADVAGWEPWILEWTEEFQEQLGVKASERSPIGVDMRGNQARLVPAHEALIEAIRQGRLKHDEDSILRRHLLNVVYHPTKWGMSYRKETAESKYKIDAYAAMHLAFMAMQDATIRSKKLPADNKRRRQFLIQ